MKDLVAEMFHAGATWGQIARETGLTYNGVRSKAYKMGLKRERSVLLETPAPKTIVNRKYKQKHREKWIAHKAVTAAKADGRLKPQPCEICGESKVHAHHDDYAKRLEVRWLCRECHEYQHHRRQNE